MKERVPNCILAAEDSTNFPGVTAPADQGGLGFDLKWNMGWMHDTLEYFQLDPSARTDAYHKLTFSMMYAYNEHYLLPLSHDEGSAWKGDDSAEDERRLRTEIPTGTRHVRLYDAASGKKLNFMGNELGQLYEWSEAGTLDWALAERPFHRFSTACA